MKTKFHFADVTSGLVVFLVALPLCLGVALASNAPIMSGIIAGVVGGIIVGLLSNSRFSVTGPAAGLTAIIAGAITHLTSTAEAKKLPPEVALANALEILFLAVIVAGLIQILFGLIKAGTIANFFPSSAIKGMLCGIGITLIIKQIPHFFGYDKDPEGDMSFDQPDHENTFTELYRAMENICHPSLIIGAIGLTILIIWELKIIKRNKILSFIPAPLLVVTAGVLLNLMFQKMGGEWIIKSEHLVDFPEIFYYDNTFAQGQEVLKFNAELFKLPDFTQLLDTNVLMDVLKIGGVIALVATIETLLCIEAVDKLDPEKYVTNTNRELLAQGTGNLFSGLLGGLPVTSVIVRSSANINAGAKTKISTIIHGVFLGVAIIAIPFVLKLIPYSALAAILIFTGYKLAKVSIFKSAFKQGWKYWVPFIATIVVMLLTDLLKGVGVGLIIAFIFILIENMQIPFKVSYEKYNDKKQFILQVSQHITFLHKSAFVKTLNRIPDGSHVIVDARKTRFMDRDVTELLNEFKTTAHHKDITVEYLNIKEVETLGH